MMTACLQILATFLFWLFMAGYTPQSSFQPKIDREALVRRHMVRIEKTDPMSSLTIGNGSFAYTVDISGLQTFPAYYNAGIPLGTQSDWGWHSFINTEGYSVNECIKEYDFHGRYIPYDVQWPPNTRKQQAAEYFRSNPHRLHLGIIGLDLIHEDGSPVGIDEIDSVAQTLDPWTGEIHSHFHVSGHPVDVFTVAHQQIDVVAARIISPLVQKGLLRIQIKFAYPDGKHTSDGCDWSKPDAHESNLTVLSDKQVRIERVLDDFAYQVEAGWDMPASITEVAGHTFRIEPDRKSDQFSFSCGFYKDKTGNPLPGFFATQQNSKEKWMEFWMSGGAVDLSECTDPRAYELERRIVLSQYLTKVQCAGLYPPQETGLTYNSWFGKFHLEMYWWHAVHFLLWNRPEAIEKSMSYYSEISAAAESMAAFQGFKGYRWPKMTDPSGVNSPSSVGSFLIWQQPHIIYLAEMLYRLHPDPSVLGKYGHLVYQTARFMASYAWFDSTNNWYVLGPALMPVQERYPAETTINPPFELAYWFWGLNTARKWRERAGLEVDDDLLKVLEHLTNLPLKSGLYTGAESAPDSNNNPLYMTDHPSVLGAFGLLPGSRLIDTTVMEHTFRYILDNWNWDETWGWDFPMTAMTAVRLGMPDQAIDALFMNVATNTYLMNGHNYQNDALRIYLPGNGGLLAAVAMMCAGFDGCTEKNPGFPKNGKWNVKWEGLNPMI